jgi:hypothetical protein
LVFAAGSPASNAGRNSRGNAGHNSRGNAGHNSRGNPGGTPSGNPGGAPAPNPGGAPAPNPGGTPSGNPGGDPDPSPPDPNPDPNPGDPLLRQPTFQLIAIALGALANFMYKQFDVTQQAHRYLLMAPPATSRQIGERFQDVTNLVRRYPIAVPWGIAIANRREMANQALPLDQLQTLAHNFMIRWGMTRPLLDANFFEIGTVEQRAINRIMVSLVSSVRAANAPSYESLARSLTQSVNQLSIALERSADSRDKLVQAMTANKPPATFREDFVDILRQANVIFNTYRVHADKAREQLQRLKLDQPDADEKKETARLTLHDCLSKMSEQKDVVDLVDFPGIAGGDFEIAIKALRDSAERKAVDAVARQAQQLADAIEAKHAADAKFKEAQDAIAKAQDAMSYANEFGNKIKAGINAIGEAIGRTFQLNQRNLFDEAQTGLNKLKEMATEYRVPDRFPNTSAAAALQNETEKALRDQLKEAKAQIAKLQTDITSLKRAHDTQITALQAEKKQAEDNRDSSAAILKSIRDLFKAPLGGGPERDDNDITRELREQLQKFAEVRFDIPDLRRAIRGNDNDLQLSRQLLREVEKKCQKNAEEVAKINAKIQAAKSVNAIGALTNTARDGVELATLLISMFAEQYRDIGSLLANPPRNPFGPPPQPPDALTLMTHYPALLIPALRNPEERKAHNEYMIQNIASMHEKIEQKYSPVFLHIMFQELKDQAELAEKVVGRLMSKAKDVPDQEALRQLAHALRDFTGVQKQRAKQQEQFAAAVAAADRTDRYKDYFKQALEQAQTAQTATRKAIQAITQRLRDSGRVFSPNEQDQLVRDLDILGNDQRNPPYTKIFEQVTDADIQAVITAVEKGVQSLRKDVLGRATAEAEKARDKAYEERRLAKEEQKRAEEEVERVNSVLTSLADVVQRGASNAMNAQELLAKTITESQQPGAQPQPRQLREQLAQRAGDVATQMFALDAALRTMSASWKKNLTEINSQVQAILNDPSKFLPLSRPRTTTADEWGQATKALRDQLLLEKQQVERYKLDLELAALKETTLSDAKKKLRAIAQAFFENWRKTLPEETQSQAGLQDDAKFDDASARSILNENVWQSLFTELNAAEEEAKKLDKLWLTDAARKRIAKELAKEDPSPDAVSDEMLRSNEALKRRVGELKLLVQQLKAKMPRPSKSTATNMDTGGASDDQAVKELRLTVRKLRHELETAIRKRNEMTAQLEAKRTESINVVTSTSAAMVHLRKEYEKLIVFLEPALRPSQDSFTAGWHVSALVGAGGDDEKKKEEEDRQIQSVVTRQGTRVDLLNDRGETWREAHNRRITEHKVDVPPPGASADDFFSASAGDAEVKQPSPTIAPQTTPEDQGVPSITIDIPRNPQSSLRATRDREAYAARGQTQTPAPRSNAPTSASTLQPKTAEKQPSKRVRHGIPNPNDIGDAPSGEEKQLAGPRKPDTRNPGILPQTLQAPRQQSAIQLGKGSLGFSIVYPPTREPATPKRTSAGAADILDSVKQETKTLETKTQVQPPNSEPRPRTVVDRPVASKPRPPMSRPTEAGPPAATPPDSTAAPSGFKRPRPAAPEQPTVNPFEASNDSPDARLRDEWFNDRLKELRLQVDQYIRELNKPFIPAMRIQAFIDSHKTKLEAAVEKAKKMIETGRDELKKRADELKKGVEELHAMGGEFQSKVRRTMAKASKNNRFLSLDESALLGELTNLIDRSLKEEGTKATQSAAEDAKAVEALINFANKETKREIKFTTNQVTEATEELLKTLSQAKSAKAAMDQMRDVLANKKKDPKFISWDYAQLASFATATILSPANPASLEVLGMLGAGASSSSGAASRTRIPRTVIDSAFQNAGSAERVDFPIFFFTAPENRDTHFMRFVHFARRMAGNLNGPKGGVKAVITQALLEIDTVALVLKSYQWVGAQEKRAVAQQVLKDIAAIPSEIKDNDAYAEEAALQLNYMAFTIFNNTNRMLSEPRVSYLHMLHSLQTIMTAEAAEAVERSWQVLKKAPGSPFKARSMWDVIGDDGEDGISLHFAQMCAKNYQVSDTRCSVVCAM